MRKFALFAFLLSLGLLPFIGTPRNAFTQAHGSVGTGMSLRFQSNGVNLATRSGGLVNFNCGVNVGCSWSGSTLTLTAGSTPPNCGSGTTLSLYEPYMQATTSATTLTDYGPGANAGTFASSTAAPTWLGNQSGIVFSGQQSISIPAAALNNAQTIMMWFSLSSPQQQDATSGLTVMLSNGAGSYIQTYNSMNGVVLLGHGGSQDMTGNNRYQGNSSFAATLPSSGLNALYINGRPVSAYLHSALTPVWTSASAGTIGVFPGGSFGSSMVFYGSLACSNVLTSAQIAANDQAFKLSIQQAAGVSFPDVQPNNFYLFDGDSRWWNAGASEEQLNSLPYLYMQAAGISDPYNAIPIFGQTQATINTNQAANEFSLSDGVTGGARVFLDEGGYNDISASTAAATVLTSLETWCSNISTRYPGAITLISTIIPSSALSSTNEGHRTTLNSSILSAWRAGTLGCSGVIDEASDPTASTQVVPNAYNPSGSGAYNSTYYVDGTHYLGPLTALMQSRGGAAILAAKGLLQKPYWVSVTYPAVDVAAAGLASTSIAMPVWNLGPGQRVCGVAAHVTAGFTGATTPTYEVGDTATSATAYISSTVMSSPGNGTSYVGLGNATNSQVEVTFGAANSLSNAAAGSVTIDVCVTTAP